jgi:hypothetical protein
VGYAHPLRRGLLKGGYRLAKNELLRLKYMANGLQQFLMERLVLALKVQHGHILGLASRKCWLCRRYCRFGCPFHLTMVSADEEALSHRLSAQGRFLAAGFS